MRNIACHDPDLEKLSMRDSHPLIFLWTHPRSVSSALERVMLQRGDLETLHEPFIYLYYLGDARKSLDI